MQEALMPRRPWMAESGPAAIQSSIAAGSRSHGVFYVDSNSISCPQSEAVNGS